MNNGNFVSLMLGASKHTLTPDDTVVISLNVKNEGAVELTGVTVNFSLDPDITYVVASALYSYNNGNILPIDNIYGTSVSFVLPDILEPGDTATLSFAVTVSDRIGAGASYVLNVSASSNEFPSGMVTDNVIFSTSFARISACKKNVDNNSFILELKNTGNITADNIVVTDMLPCPFSLRDIYVDDTRLELGVNYTLDGSCVTINLPYAIDPDESICIRFLS